MPTEPKSIPQVITELKELTVTYAKQETVDPVKDLGRFLVRGVPGSLLATAGFGLISLSFLRALQTETGSRFTGSWSWAPYALCFVFLAVIVGIAGVLIVRGPSR